MGINAREVKSYVLRTYNDPRYVFSMNWRDGLDLVIYDIERENNKEVNDIRKQCYERLFCWMVKGEIKYFSFESYVDFLENGTPLYENKVKEINKNLTDDEILKILDDSMENRVWRE